ncbi:MAG TPA: TetR family transcriptional regulator [Phenylobacterium sp.]|uniref:TetR/AcrR family transcriptional regulator n=1 Tax=Phenylobacterium sp. TaxID=1871053 RepID=UPI002B498100|nr:TetR family transcriptional regulator [Phenylobacterium sp.]HKR87121.1 TetR family transcriptional regulator [Phenylobacterium sp.]
MLGQARRGTTQARGRARRLQLLAAAKELLAEREIDQITLSEVAARAGIPKSSSYHFYNDMQDLYAELATSLDEELHQLFVEPARAAENWAGIVEEFVRRAHGYFDANIAAQKLMFGPKAPPSIKSESRRADRRHSELLERQIDSQFVLPQFEDRDRIFFRAVEAMDLMFSLSLIEYDQLSPKMVDEAYCIAVAYLQLYIPAELPRRML